MVKVDTSAYSHGMNCQSLKPLAIYIKKINNYPGLESFQFHKNRLEILLSMETFHS